MTAEDYLKMLIKKEKAKDRHKHAGFSGPTGQNIGEHIGVDFGTVSKKRKAKREGI